MRTVLVTLLALLMGCAVEAPVATTRPAIASSSQPARPVAAVWFDRGYPRPGDTGEVIQLVVAVWNDGKIVWSENRVTGGTPYRAASIDPDRVERMLAGLEAAGFFIEPREVNYGPDASHMVLAADHRARAKQLASWHEPPRDDPMIVVDERGIWRLQPGQTRPAPSPAYAQFLQTWSKSRALIEELIPTNGEPVSTIDQAIFRTGARQPK